MIIDNTLKRNKILINLKDKILQQGAPKGFTCSEQENLDKNDAFLEQAVRNINIAFLIHRFNFFTSQHCYGNTKMKSICCVISFK